jgi:hypothetical protein
MLYSSVKKTSKRTWALRKNNSSCGSNLPVVQSMRIWVHKMYQTFYPVVKVQAWFTGSNTWNGMHQCW